MALTFDSLGKMGRLGNQMFQYAALRGISTNLGYDFMIPSNNELCEVFGIKAKFGCSGNHKVTHNKFNFDEILFSSCLDNVDLTGYFQSEKYFKQIENQIKKEYSFSNKIYTICSHFIKTNFTSDIISLHVRRGDYLTESNFVNLDLNYYNTALRLLPSFNVLIFSDDISWCKSNFFGEEFYFIESKNKEIDLCLMTMCNYHIIANSSFSWWGSWLSKSKKTIAPSRWFQNEYSSWNTEDLYLPDWIVI